MMTLLDVLDRLGQATWQPVWVPVLVWTVFALPLWVFLKRAARLHPNAEYRLSQVLLATLPGGLIAVALFNVIPAASAVVPLPEVSVTVSPAVEAVETVDRSSPLWTWSLAVGLFTVGALIVGLMYLGRLAFDAVAAARVYALAGRPPSDEIQDLVARLTDTLEVPRPVRVCLAPDAVVPVTLGGTRPTILLPSALPNSPEALRMTLVHECIHIRRYDDVAHMAERIVAATFAIHPLVNRLCRHIAEARERACDAAVLEGDHASPGAYARLLTAFAERPHPGRLGTLALSESESSLITRLAAMRSSVSRLLSSPLALGTTLLGVGLALTLGVVACSDGVAPPSQTSTESSTAKQSSASDDGEVYKAVEDRPKLIGGMEALAEEVTYPEMAKEAGIEGQVFVRFIVDEQGNVQDPRVTKGKHKLLNEAAVEAVKQQEFEPGLQLGEPVKVQMTLPVTFKLPTSSLPDAPDSQGRIELPEPQGAPKIEGGHQALQQELSYPDLLRKAGIEGTVRVTFTVDETGAVQRPRVTKSVHEALDTAAIEAVKNVSFIPAEENGTPISTQMTLPITFHLPDDQE